MFEEFDSVSQQLSTLAQTTRYHRVLDTQNGFIQIVRDEDDIGTRDITSRLLYDVTMKNLMC